MENQVEEILAIQYTEACRTGVGLIDTEHQHLFELMNQVLESIHKPELDTISLEEYLHLLLAYGNTHFAHEEAHMESIADPELVHQRLAHQSFMNKVQAVDLHGLDDGEKEQLVRHLIQYNVEWLYKHILGSDILIGKMVHRADAVTHQMTEQGEVSIYCPFEERLVTGNAELDEIHREWFSVLNQAYCLLEENYHEEDYDQEMTILDHLEEKFIAGFNREEELMKEGSYPRHESWEHRHAHESCLGRLQERDLAHDDPNPKMVIEEMLDFLYAWLVNHIRHLDMAMVEELGI